MQKTRYQLAFSPNKYLYILIITFILSFYSQTAPLACTCTSSTSNCACTGSFTSCDSSCSSGCYLSLAGSQDDGMGCSCNQYVCEPCNVNNCKTCTSLNFCTACQIGYTLSSPTFCKNCTLQYGGPSCINCNQSQCTSCAAGWVHNTGYVDRRCFQCSLIPNCAGCNIGPVCSTCISGGYVRSYSLPYYACVLCNLPNCQSCSDGPKCSTCNTDYCIDNNTPNGDCIHYTSLPNCAQCTNGPTCLVCQPDFYLDYGMLNKSCVACTIPNCIACIDGPKCTACDTDYVLNNATLNTTCIRCDQIPNCLQCNHGPVCTHCQPGYYLNTSNSKCFKCQFPCVECTSLTTCTTCPTNLLYYFDSSANTCKLCYNNLTNCLQCDMAGTQCSKCSSTLYFLDSNNQCTGCNPPCLNCISSNKCLNCINHNFFYNQTSFQCIPCSNYMSKCVNCLKQNVCTVCDTSSTTYYLTYPPMSCVTCTQARPDCQTCAQSNNKGPICTLCNNKFYLDNDSCFNCPYSCALCTSMTVCSSCISNFYALSNQMCTLCGQLITNCLQCSSDAICIRCTNNTVKDPNGSGSCISCTNVQYNDDANQLCQPCNPPCLSCLNANDCVNCVQFYEHVPAINRCQDICGDSIVMTSLCDNGPGILNDGCSDQCTPDPDFSCSLTSDTVNGIAVQRSTCSYTLKVTSKIKTITKEPFKNTMTWTYIITPYLYGLPGTTSRDFTQDELKKTFVLYEKIPGPTTSSTKSSSSNNVKSSKITVANPGLTVDSVSVDSVNSQVSVTFSYDKNIQQSQLQLYVDFTYLKSTLNLPHFAATPDSDHLYLVSSYRPQSMIGQYYTEEQYSQAGLIYKLAMTISILSFLAFVIGIFTKEVVGLQMAMLCQFAYLSLFYFQGTLQLPYFALKSLIYSTGYNIPLTTVFDFSLLDVDPPQSLALQFDPTTFSNNFNLMTALYILPLVLVIPFIPLKAKCIRKISMIELGHKWVDLLLGEIMLFCVLFNFQYLLFGLIVFYRDGRNTKHYASSMIIWWGVLCTIGSFLGLIFKPEIYGNFRTVFKYDTQLRKQIIDNKMKVQQYQQHLTKKFNGQKKCQGCKKLILRFSLFMNENYFWKNYRKFHAILSYNHYTVLIIYFTLMIILNCFISGCEVIMIGISLILLIDLILIRPYGEVSQKLRSIYFILVYIFVISTRLIHGHTQRQYSLMGSLLILFLLIIALIWTFYTLGKYFYSYFVQYIQNKNDKIMKVFAQNDLLDKTATYDQQQNMMRKLMKRYQRVQLQYNVQNARNQLLLGYQEILRNKSLDKKQFNQQAKQSNLQANDCYKEYQSGKDIFYDQQVKQILKKAQEEKNYKHLKGDLRKEYLRKKKGMNKNKVKESEMLKLLKLDNFNKYEKQYLYPQKPDKELNQQITEQHLDSFQQRSKKDDQQQNEGIIQRKNKKLEIQCEDGNQNNESEYMSVEPKDLQEAEQKIAQQRVLVQQNQFVRFKRAKQILIRDGTTIDRKLINENYDKI